MFIVKAMRKDPSYFLSFIFRYLNEVVNIEYKQFFYNTILS